MTRSPGQEFLSAEFERRVKANARYSLRAFARDLTMSPGEVSEILSGKRALTPKAIAKISSRLGLCATETQELLGVNALGSAGIEGALPESKRELSLDLFRVVSDWYCFAILNLFDTPGFRPDAQLIGRRLGISAAEAKIALERLERVGLLRREHGKLVPDSSFVMSPNGVPSEAIRNYHRTMLEKAILALETQPVSDRNVTGLGLAVDPRDLPEIEADLKKFRDKIATKYARGKRTEVYQLETAFFRITEKGIRK